MNSDEPADGSHTTGVGVGIQMLTAAILVTWIMLANYAIPHAVVGFFCSDSSIFQPIKPETFHIVTLCTISFCIPVICVLLTERLRWPTCDGTPTRTFLCGKPISPAILVFYRFIGAFVMGGLVTVSLTLLGKITAGRLRPRFIAVCEPLWSSIECITAEGNPLYVEQPHCQNKDLSALRESRLSFPSGHASLIFYSMVFSCLYLQARLFDASHPHRDSDEEDTGRSFHSVYALQKSCPLLQTGMVALALWVCVSRVTNHMHHASDVLAGGTLGFLVALVVCFPMFKSSGRSKRGFRNDALSKDEDAAA